VGGPSRVNFSIIMCLLWGGGVPTQTPSFPPTHQCFFGSILCYSQSGNHPQEGLAKFLLQAKYESNLKKTSFYIFWLPT
jgi:hypothetical protein